MKVTFSDDTYNAIARLGNELSNAAPEIKDPDNLGLASSVINRLQFEDREADIEVTEKIEAYGYENVVKAAADRLKSSVGESCA